QPTPTRRRQVAHHLRPGQPSSIPLKTGHLESVKSGQLWSVLTLVDGAPIDGAFPIGFWGNALEVELDYLLTEEDFLLSVRQAAERLRAKVVGWRVVVSAP
ncbi:hypothetical protein K1I42_10740, partial [Hydrogenophilus thermoluteolus]